jgi:hypothetical protein
VLVGREEHPVAISPPVGEVGQGAQPDEVRGAVEGEALGRCEARAALDLVGDRVQQRVAHARSIELAGHRISLADRQ